MNRFERVENIGKKAIEILTAEPVDFSADRLFDDVKEMSDGALQRLAKGENKYAKVAIRALDNKHISSK